MNAHPAAFPARGLALLALGLGVAGDLLLRRVPPGINLMLWAWLGLGTLFGFARHMGWSIPRASWPWLGVAGLCATLAAVRGSPLLLAFTLAFGGVSLLVATWIVHGGRLASTSITDLLVNLGIHAARIGLGLLVWFPRPGPASDEAPPVPASTPRPYARAAIGALAAIPLLVLFSALFSSADPIFAQGVRRAFDVDFELLLSHAFLIGLWTWLSAGFGRRLLSGIASPAEYSLPLRPPERSPDVEVLTVLGLLAALFLAFVGIQARYLAGSDVLVQQTVGLTYAEYARRGFFELLAATALVLPILLAGDWALRHSPWRRSFRIVAGTLVVLMGLIAASAARRLYLYTQAYGLTEDRLYASAILLWILILAAWFAVTVLPGRRDRFCAGALVSALLVLLSLHALNPDAFIAERNLARSRAGHEFDLEHALRLGPDAVPVLLAHREAIPADQQSKFLESLRRRHCGDGSPPDWRTWNLARARARAALLASTP